MRKEFMVLAAALIALPIFAQEKKPTVTPTPSANRSTNLNSSKSNRDVQSTVTPSVEGKPTKEQRQEQGLTPTPDAKGGKPTKEQRQMTGKVIRQSGSTFTVLSGGKEITFSSKAGDTLPKVGETIDITYTQTPSGPQAITIIRSKSNITNN